VLGALVLLGSATPASAHPLGNTTVNHYDGLELSPEGILDHAVEDLAEIPTYQRRAQVDTDRSGTASAGEQAAYAAARCADMARTVAAEVDGKRVAFRVLSSSYAERAGAVGLTAGRLDCELSGSARLTTATTVDFRNTWDDDGIGWHEITAVGKGVVLRDSPFPAVSISDALRSYPDDLLSSPLDVRGGSVRSLPGTGTSTYDAVKDLPVAGPAARYLNRLSNAFNNTAGSEHLTIGVGLLGLLLALMLGAGHAFLPGHGKTIMAAYLVGKRGSLRDVVTVGATVTLTHTAGVLILGLAITSSAAFAPAQAERWLGVVSGLIVGLVGVGLLVSAVRNPRRPVLQQLAPQPELVTVGGHSHDHHGHDHHDHDHGQEHEAPAVHAHGKGIFARTHSHDPAAKGFSKGGLVGLGVAGGLVPSPSALLVLLAATALGRTYFGVVLVLGYGLGMALALCAAGLLLVKLRGRLERLAGNPRLARAEKLLAVLPVFTALLVLAVGALLALRALGGSV
jgi:ABC-type nickel/cobalt efflux system permease component RcnA